MPSSTVSPGDADSPIRIVVTPSQSSYFAGEPFCVKVTFTNTRSPEAVSAKPSPPSHKRGSHSISSAPLARPPTSPGTPRSIAVFSVTRPNGLSEAPRRKNLIGKLNQSSAFTQGSEQRRKRHFSISPYEIRDSCANELILYSYAQLTGTLVLTPVPEVPSTTEQIQVLNSVRSALLNRAVLGGGSVDITSSLNSPNPTSPRSPRPRQTHSRSASLSAGLLSILSPTSLTSSLSSPNPNSTSSSRWRSTSGYAPGGTPPLGKLMAGNPNSPSVFGLGFGNGASSEIDPEEPLPTFEVQPAMLAVDLSLAPGESRSYTYTVKLPNNLPPTFKGRSLKISYELVIGTCRAAGGGGMGTNSISRVMKVPIRVYNNISVGNLSQPYDLLWPVGRRRDLGISDMEATVEEDAQNAMFRVPRHSSPVSSPMLPSSNTLESIKDYARSLLKSLPEPNLTVHEGHNSLSSSDGPVSQSPPNFPAENPEGMDSGVLNGNGNALGNGKQNRHHNIGKLPKLTQHDRSENWRELERDKEAEGGLTGCREAVEILTRNPKKVSYDVNKDGSNVAVLTFTKSAYRLGETITGIVELNERRSRARVLKVSAVLESHESLPSSISPTSSGKYLRRSHAEGHSSFTLNTLRTTFSLDIPSDASPAFQICVNETPSATNSASSSPSPASTPGGLVWKVRLCLFVGIASEQSITGLEGVRFRTLNRDGPRGEWGTSWMATSSTAPLEKRDLRLERESQRQEISSPTSWSRFLVNSFFGRISENDDIKSEADTLDSLHGNDHSHGDARRASRSSSFDYDGIIPDPGGGVGAGVDFLGGEEGWKEVKLETVECEVPVKVFPGNTAFRSLDVVFDV